MSVTAVAAAGVIPVVVIPAAVIAAFVIGAAVVMMAGGGRIEAQSTGQQRGCLLIGAACRTGYSAIPCLGQSSACAARRSRRR